MKNIPFQSGEARRKNFLIFISSYRQVYFYHRKDWEGDHAK